MNNSSFYSQESNNLPQYKVIILGLSSTGKTSLLTRYQQNFYDVRGKSTMSVDFKIQKRQKAWYYYYDTCGQEIYRAIVSHYYKGSDACIIAYDVTNPKTFQEISYYYNEVKENTPDSLLYIVGCKADMKRKVFEEDIGKRYKGIKHFVTSSKTDQGVREAFAQIEKDLIELKPKVIPDKRRDVLKPIDFDGPNSRRISNKKSCC